MKEIAIALFSSLIVAGIGYAIRIAVVAESPMSRLQLGFCCIAMQAARTGDATLSPILWGIVRAGVALGL